MARITLTSAPPIDMQAVAHAFGDGEFRARLVELLRETSARDGGRIREAAARCDWAMIAACSHRLKGSAAAMSAWPLCTACKALELAARSGEAQMIAAHLDAFELELARLQAFLAQRP